MKDPRHESNDIATYMSFGLKDPPGHKSNDSDVASYFTDVSFDLKDPPCESTHNHVASYSTNQFHPLKTPRAAENDRHQQETDTPIPVIHEPRKRKIQVLINTLHS